MSQEQAERDRGKEQNGILRRSQRVLCVDGVSSELDLLARQQCSDALCEFRESRGFG